jgi:uncharacterized protein YgiM (DUF1202 family)
MVKFSSEKLFCQDDFYDADVQSKNITTIQHTQEIYLPMLRRLTQQLLMIALALLMIPAVTAQANIGTLPQVTPLRSGPGFDAPQYETFFPANAAVQVIARDAASDWYFVRMTPAQGAQTTMEGWIQARYLNFGGTVPQGTATGTVTASPLNLYLRPDTTNTVINTLPAGTQLQVSGKDSTDTWYFVRRPDGAYNWTPANGIRLTSGNRGTIPVWITVPSTPPESSQPGSPTLRTNAAVYTAPTGVSSFTQTLPAGTAVNVVVRDAQEDWYFIRASNGQVEGWVSSAAVNFAGSVPQGTAQGPATTDTLNLYDAPMNNADVGNTLPGGEPVIVSGQDATGTWYYLETYEDDNFYWAPAQHIRLNIGNPNGIPTWNTVNSEPFVPGATTFTGTTTQQASVYTRVYGDAAPQPFFTLGTNQTVDVIAFTGVRNGYYLVRLRDGRLGWVDAAALTVPGSVPQI